MSIPHFEFPDSPHIAGNLSDDDGRVIDSLVESAAEPPKPADIPKDKIDGIKEATPKPITRLMTRTLVMDQSWSPVQLAPADPDRKALHITIISATATDFIRFSDDAGKLNGGQANIPVGVGGIDIPHTGPVWAWAPDSIGPITVSVVAVTL